MPPSRSTVTATGMSSSLSSPLARSDYEPLDARIGFGSGGFGNRIARATKHHKGDKQTRRDSPS